jgi:ribosome-associated protein
MTNQPEKKITAEDKVALIRELCEDVKATDLNVVNVQGKSMIADYYIVCTGNSEPHLKAIANRVHYELKDRDLASDTIDGDYESHWIVQDYGDVILHIFHPDARQHYNVEQLWASDMESMPWDCPEQQILRDELLRRPSRY